MEPDHDIHYIRSTGSAAPIMLEQSRYYVKRLPLQARQIRILFC